MLPLLLLPLLQPPQTDAAVKAVTERLTQMRAEASFPGMTAAWVLPDGTVRSVSIGLADKEQSRPMPPNARMLAGSIGKTFFLAAMLKLVEQGRLDLDKKVAYYVGGEPWFKDVPNASKITLRQLLNHTSGIPEHVAMPEFLQAVKAAPDKAWTPVELLSYVRNKPPLFVPGEGWGYADTNFILASYAAERATGVSLYRMIEAEILRPLRLDQTAPSVSRTIPGLVQGYSMPNSPFGFTGPMLQRGVFAFNPQMEWAGGGFVSSSRDLARWAKALYEGRVISAASVKLSVDAAVPARTGPGDRYGLGVQVRQSPLGVSYGHGGWFPGYLSEMEYFPEKRIAVAVQFNTDHMAALRGRPRTYLLEVAKLVAGG